MILHIHFLEAKPFPSNHHLLLPIQCHNQIFIRSVDVYIPKLLVTTIKKEPILQRMPVFETRFNKVHIYK